MYVSRCEGDLTVKTKLHSLKIKDELQGSLSSHPQYLACSFLGDQDTGPLNLLEHGRKELLMMEEDDNFKDALPEFMLLPDSSEAGIDEKDQSKGKSVVADVFYEAEGADDSDFVSVIYLTRNPDSPDYDGIDTQVMNDSMFLMIEMADALDIQNLIC